MVAIDPYPLLTELRQVIEVTRDEYRVTPHIRASVYGTQIILDFFRKEAASAGAPFGPLYELHYLGCRVFMDRDWKSGPPWFAVCVCDAPGACL